jgi:YebC/PmpR family DNA-binding regulatory protein
MSGHSKWATIKRKKGAIDAKRGQMFTKLIKEIMVAAKMGGGDLDSNARLRAAVTKARAANMPRDNIERAIKKGMGELDGQNFVENVYEGYAPGGVAIMIETLTDNKNRTAADVRSILTKNGGNMGAEGCVSYLFKRKGILTYDASKYSEDQVFELALEGGAEDVSSSDGVIELSCAPDDFESVLETLEKAGFKHESAEIVQVADTRVTLDQEQTLKVLKVIDLLESNDDVQAVSTNLEIPEDMDIDS